MAAPIVTIATALARLGFSVGGPEESDVNALLLAVSDEVRKLTRRALEGAPTVYRETYEPEVRTVFLPHVPVTDVLSVRPVHWDRSEDEIDLPIDVVGGASTTLAAAAAVGATNLKVTATTDLAVGDHVRIGAGLTREVLRVKTVGTAGAGGTGLDVEPALRFAQFSGATLREVSGAEAWRLMSAPFGRLKLLYPRRFVEVVYRVTGEIPDSINEAVLEWIEARWTTTPSRLAGLVSYKTGDDSETYSDAIAGAPPRSVSRALGLIAHRRGAAVI